MRSFLPFATLLGAAFLLGCQEQASSPVGLDGLGPQFHASHLTCEGHRKNEAGCDGNGDLLEFNVTVTSMSNHISAAIKAGTGDRNQILVKNFVLDFGTSATTFFTSAKLACEITGMQTGSFTLNKTSGSNPSGSAFIIFFFTYNGIKHALNLDGTITTPANWLPTTSNTVTERPATSGTWEVTAQGKNHQNGCTGEGVGLVFTSTVAPKT